LTWKNIDLKREIIILEDTKNDERRATSTLSKIDPFMLTKIDPLTARVLAAV
jgi:hypothetical protein